MYSVLTPVTVMDIHSMHAFAGGLYREGADEQGHQLKRRRSTHFGNKCADASSKCTSGHTPIGSSATLRHTPTTQRVHPSFAGAFCMRKLSKVELHRSFFVVAVPAACSLQPATEAMSSGLHKTRACMIDRPQVWSTYTHYMSSSIL